MIDRCIGTTDPAGIERVLNGLRIERELRDVAGLQRAGAGFGEKKPFEFWFESKCTESNKTIIRVSTHFIHPKVEVNKFKKL